MSDFKIGDYVRVTYEGKVSSINEITGSFVLNASESSHGGSHRYCSLKHVSVEVVERPYEDGAYYVDADGDVFRYNSNYPDGPWNGNDGVFAFDYPERPLEKLVRESDRA
jgi:hypothetical protein